MSVKKIKQPPLLESFKILSDLNNSMPVSKDGRELLDQRLVRLASGEAEVLNWDDVKYKIGKR